MEQSGTSENVWPIERFIPYTRNPRKNDAAVDQMCASIREFGFKIPVLVKSDGTVIDGHLRLKAAHRLKLTEIPVMLCDEWSEAQVKAFRLLVNRSATWADWDDELLAVEMADLKESDFDLALTGFSDKEIKKLFDDVEATAPQSQADLPPGEFFVLIRAESEAQQAQYLERFTQEGFKCRALMA